MPMTTTTATITAIHDNDILSTNHINHNNNQQLFSSQQSTLTKDGHSNENDTKIISTSTTIHRINNNANRSNWW